VAGDRPTRRRFLRRALAGGAVLAVGGAVAWVRTRGYAVAPEKAARLEALAAWQLVVVEHAARRIVAPDTTDGSAPAVDDVEVGLYVDRYVANMPEVTRTDFLHLLGYLEHLAPAAAGKSSRFTRLSAEDQDATLAGLEASSQDLLRAGFDGLKALVMMGYYRDARTWRILGYEGPWVTR
jgi:hypothetical protein